MKKSLILLLLLLLPLLFASCSSSEEYEAIIADLEEKIVILENTNASYAERTAEAESASKKAEEDVITLKVTYLTEITDLKKQVQSLSSELEIKESEILALREQLSQNIFSPINAEPAAEPAVKYTEGQYKIGLDMPAGEYVFFPNKRGDSGYFCCTTDANGDDIINNDNFDTYSIYQVQSGEYLKLSRCYAVPLSEATLPDTGYTDGTYIVGVHIPAGEYKVKTIVTDRSGYYCIYSDLRRDDIVANDYFDGSGYIDLHEGNVVVLERCQIVVN